MVIILLLIGVIAYFIIKSTKESLFKRSCINTFYYILSSKNDEEYRRVCQFYHDRYKDGNHRIKIMIHDANSMEFNLLSEPITIGKGIMFELSSLDNRIKGIELMMLPDSAYIKFPDGSIISFRG